MYILFEIFVYSFILILGFAILWVVWLYFQDKRQTKHAVRRNFPVIGRLRYVFEHWGTFFRQYFFAQDREELPFNRAQRSWVYRAAKNLDTTVPFGSSRPNTPGSIIFANSLFPVRDEEATHAPAITFGPQCETPFHSDSLINISAMSYGAISKPAITALSHGAHAAGIWLNTGEGGLSPYHLEGGCNVIYQIGTAKFGVRNEAGDLCDSKLREIANNNAVKMFEIKLSQGAKPGKGGILPAAKVSAEIAKIRAIPEGKAAISPNRFSEINRAEDLLFMITRVRKVTGKPVGIKCCVGHLSEIDDLCRLIAHKGPDFAPDFITIDSGDGGTGAAPMSLIDNAGMLVSDSLPQVVDLLIKYDLRDRIKVIASGKLINPTDVAWALCAGADAVNSARGFMLALGCIQALQCNSNTCPTGITTHNKRLQEGLDPTEKARRVANYARNLVKEVEIIAHSCGATHPRLLTRHHARMLEANGKSRAYNDVFPVPITIVDKQKLPTE